jgi:hypothetical protein
VQIDFFSETNNLQRLRPTSEFNFAFNFAFNFDLWCYMSGYAELPDGKVLSGTESGKLLLWDGGRQGQAVPRGRHRGHQAGWRRGTALHP